MSSSSSSSSSGDESESNQSSNMNNLADLLWHKIKQNSTKSAAGSRSRSSLKPKETSQTRSKIDTVQSDVTDTVHKSDSHTRMILPDSEKMFSNLAERARQSSQTTGGKKPSDSRSTSATSSSSSIRAIYNSSAEEALKQASTKVTSIESVRQKKKQAKAEKSQWMWKQKSWGAMKMKEQTEEDKKDLMVLAMRSTIDPTRHYKHTDLKEPKFFQMATVQEDAANFYHDRIPKKQRKRTLVDELMANEEFKRKLKHQYEEVVAAKTNRKGLYQGKAPRKIKKVNLKRRK